MKDISHGVTILGDPTPISFNPYQYKPLMELRHNPDINLLISDEVGLGKTIEAGIIIDDLLFDMPTARILVVCPAFLRDKWATELDFGSHFFRIIDKIVEMIPVENAVV